MAVRELGGWLIGIYGMEGKYIDGFKEWGQDTRDIVEMAETGRLRDAFVELGVPMVLRDRVRTAVDELKTESWYVRHQEEYAVLLQNGKVKDLRHGEAFPLEGSGQWHMAVGQYKINKVLDEDDDELVKDVIGKGGHGTVYRGMFGNLRVAVKELPIEQLANFEKEVSLLHQVQHPHIVQCFGGRVMKKKVHLVLMEMKGSLSQEIWPTNASAPKLTTPRKWEIILGVASGIAYLHAVLKIAHRDVKPDNVLVSFDGVCKLSDLGSASKRLRTASGRTGRSKSSGTDSQTSCQGTEGYKAPEVYKNRCSRPADVYAFAILAYEVYTQTSPYGQLDPVTIMERVVANKRPAIPQSVREECGFVANMIQFCWKDDPHERPRMPMVELMMRNEALGGDAASIFEKWALRVPTKVQLQRDEVDKLLDEKTEADRQAKALAKQLEDAKKEMEKQRTLLQESEKEKKEAQEREAKGKGFSGAAELKKFSESGCPNKTEFDKFKLSDFDKYDTECREALDQGFSRKVDFKECKKYGCPDKPTYYGSIQAIKSGGFPSYAKYEQAKAKGFSNSKDYLEFNDSGCPNKKEFDKFKRSDFEKYNAECRRALDMGFFKRSEYKAKMVQLEKQHQQEQRRREEKARQEEARLKEKEQLEQMENDPTVKAVKAKIQRGRDKGHLLYDEAEKGHLAAVQYLVAHDADVNYKGPEGRTPLYVAAGNGHEEVTKFLLQKGAKVDQAANGSASPQFGIGQRWNVPQSKTGGPTPLYIAAFNGHRGVSALLLEKGAKVDQPDIHGFTPLHGAAGNGHRDLAALLLQKGANVDKAENSGATPLFVAAGKGHAEVVTLLLQKGANVDQAPLAIAAAKNKGHDAVVKILEGAGAK